MAKEKWFHKSFRRNLVDMHIEDWNEEFLSKFDPEDYFENLKKAHIKSPMLYIQSHIGYCYWPTKSGHIHNAFKGRESSMRHLFDLCHNGGMDVIAYYSLVYNNWAYENHPEWRIRNSDGKGSRDNGNRYGLCCPNSEGYRSFILTQIREFCEYFDFEGIFFDMTFWPYVCYCDSCKLKWSREIGGEMPTLINWEDPRWVLFQKKRQEWLGEFAELTTAEVKKYKPESSVEHQNATALFNWLMGVDEKISKASDYAGGDLYGGIEEQSFACKLYYNLTQNQPFEYMTSRCYPNLYEHTTTKSVDMLLQSILMTYAHHGASLLIDAIDPSGTLDRRVYESIGKVFGIAEKYEPFLEGHHVEDVGIYFNFNAKIDMNRKGKIKSHYYESTAEQPHLRASLGAAKALREKHIPFGVVNNWRLDQLDTLRVLILSDASFMEEREINAVRSFVKNGGNLYFSGRSAPSFVEEVFGVSYEGLTEETITYMSPTGTGIDVMPQFTYDYPMPVLSRQVKLSGAGRGEVLATMTLPYTMPPVNTELFDYSPKKDGDDGNIPSPRFASIHSNPPGKFTNLPSILRTTYGKGKVVWSAAPFESAIREQHSTIFAAIIKELGGSFSFSSNAPDVVELILFKVPEKNRHLISLINVQERFNVIEVNNFDICIKAEREPEKVILLPEEKEIPYIYADKEVILHIDRLDLFEMIAIDYTGESY